MFRRRYPEALAMFRQVPQELAEVRPDLAFEAGLSRGHPAREKGQEAEARAVFLKVKESAEAAVQEAPNEASRHARLGRVLAYLGEKDPAIAEAKRGTELLPESVDAFSGPGITQALAEVYAVTGDNAKAIEMSTDCSADRPLTVAFLKLDPTWARCATIRPSRRCSRNTKAGSSILCRPCLQA